jgi:iron complex transport system ATP-binding protein
VIEAHGLVVRRGARTVLDDAGLGVGPGEVVGLLGGNGAGKSTLLHALAGDLKLAAGSIALDGRPLESMSVTELARRRAVLTQHPTLAFPFSCLEVVCLGRLPHGGDGTCVESRCIAEAALALTGGSALADRNYATLSGGEKQCVQLARTLAQVWPEEPRSTERYLLLDEPTSHLDLAQSARALAAMLAFVERGGGVCVVLHDLTQAARVCDRVVMLAKGHVVASGTPTDVITETIVRAAYGVDVIVTRSPDGHPLVLPVARRAGDAPPTWFPEGSAPARATDQHDDIDSFRPTRERLEGTALPHARDADPGCCTGARDDRGPVAGDPLCR